MNRHDNFIRIMDLTQMDIVNILGIILTSFIKCPQQKDIKSFRVNTDAQFQSLFMEILYLSEGKILFVKTY